MQIEDRALRSSCFVAVRSPTTHIALDGPTSLYISERDPPPGTRAAHGRGKYPRAHPPPLPYFAAPIRTPFSQINTSALTKARPGADATGGDLAHAPTRSLTYSILTHTCLLPLSTRFSGSFNPPRRVPFAPVPTMSCSLACVMRDVGWRCVVVRDGAMVMARSACWCTLSWSCR